MKRSRSLSLLLMGSMAFGGLPGCSSDNSTDENFSAYTSLQECASSGTYTEDECRFFALSALQQTPQFSSLEECEKQFGIEACRQTPPAIQQLQAANSPAGNSSSVNGTSATVEQGTRSSWMPMMLGFMAGRYLAGGGMMQGSEPLYKNPQSNDKTSGARSFRTRTGETVTTDKSGRVTNPSSSLKKSLSHSAKPLVARGAKGSSGGFSGSKNFGSSGS